MQVIWQPLMGYNLIFLILHHRKMKQKKGSKKRKCCKYTIYCILSQTSGNEKTDGLPSRLVGFSSYTVSATSGLLTQFIIRAKPDDCTSNWGPPVLHTVCWALLFPRSLPTEDHPWAGTLGFLGPKSSEGVSSQMPSVATSAASRITCRSWPIQIHVGGRRREWQHLAFLDFFWFYFKILLFFENMTECCHSRKCSRLNNVPQKGVSSLFGRLGEHSLSTL